MYECSICHTPIESHQLRHSDGLGHYHMVCEFNEEREKLGLPRYEDVRKIRFISGFVDPTTTPSGKNNSDNVLSFA